MTEKNIAVLVGSLRKESFNRKMANNMVRLAPPSLRLEILEIEQLPMYNQDLDADPPQAWVDFKQRIKASDGVIFVTPEYNRSIPGVLKNAIDAASRPYGQSAWDGKPAAVISVSPGAIGGFGANHHLRQSLVFLNMPVLQQPEAYIGGASTIFDEKGDLVNESTREFVRKFIHVFAEWVLKFSSGPELKVQALDSGEAKTQPSIGDNSAPEDKIHSTQILDKVDQASKESFPASDSPGWGP